MHSCSDTVTALLLLYLWGNPSIMHDCHARSRHLQRGGRGSFNGVGLCCFGQPCPLVPTFFLLFLQLLNISSVTWQGTEAGSLELQPVTGSSSSVLPLDEVQFIRVSGVCSCTRSGGEGSKQLLFRNLSRSLSPAWWEGWRIAMRSTPSRLSVMVHVLVGPETSRLDQQRENAGSSIVQLSTSSLHYSSQDWLSFLHWHGINVSCAQKMSRPKTMHAFPENGFVWLPWAMSIWT